MFRCFSNSNSKCTERRVGGCVCVCVCVCVSRATGEGNLAYPHIYKHANPPVPPTGDKLINR